MSKQFTITLDKDQHAVQVLHLSGRLDADGSQMLLKSAMDLKSQGHKNVIIHLGDLEFVASSGLGTFLLLTEEFVDVGGVISLVAPSADVRQVISLMNIDQFLNIVDTVEEAVGIVNG